MSWLYIGRGPFVKGHHLCLLLFLAKHQIVEVTLVIPSTNHVHGFTKTQKQLISLTIIVEPIRISSWLRDPQERFIFIRPKLDWISQVTSAFSPPWVWISQATFSIFSSMGSTRRLKKRWRHGCFPSNNLCVVRILAILC